MTKEMKRVLVTGALGQIGTALLPVLIERFGATNIIASDIKPASAAKLPSELIYENLDVRQADQIAALVRKHQIDTIFHMAAILSASGEKNPHLAWEVNLLGTYNILEVARELELVRVFVPSSIAVFGPETPRENTPQDTVLSPTTMYGVTKVAGESLCEYYHLRYGLDVRGLRFPGIISSETPPGGGTTDYAVEIFYRAVEGQPYTCFVRPDTVLPMMYMPDCLKATLQLMEADPQCLRYRIYNVTALSFSAEELAREIGKHVPGFRVEYEPDFRQEIADSWPRTIDDSAAREDWGWQPDYDLTNMVEDMLARLKQRLAREKGRAP